MNPAQPAPGGPSPYCGRVDDHPAHDWSRGRRGPRYWCPGPPVRTLAERQLAAS